MNINLAVLPNDVGMLHRMIGELATTLDTERVQAQTEIARLRQILKTLQRGHFGRRSERLEPDQLQLALEDLVADIARIKVEAPPAEGKAPAVEPPPGDRASAGLLAQVLVAKYCDDLPLYRQSQIFARQGVTLNRSTLANWVGGASWWLEALCDRLAAQVFGSEKLFADDTPIPVLDPGRTALGLRVRQSAVEWARSAGRRLLLTAPTARQSIPRPY